MKTAIVHDWLAGIGGAERVLKAMIELYPSPIYTLVCDSTLLPEGFSNGNEIFTSFIQKLPFARKGYRNYLPLYPYAIEQFDLGKYDIILSSSHAVAKNVITNANQLHICYCHTPMRYAWDLYHQYTHTLKGVKKQLAQLILHSLRKWDYTSSPRVDHFIANSHYVAARIKKNYAREASVIYPPVATHLFEKGDRREEFYLTVSRLVPYKKIDLIVEAFSEMPDKKLIVIGDGPDWIKVKAQAKKNIELLGHQSNESVREYMRKAKAFVFAAEEDFGISVVEAQAAGTAVLAYQKGGALETVVAGKTGLFFPHQTTGSIIQAVQEFENRYDRFDPAAIKEHAEQFSEERFKKEYCAFVNQKAQDFYENCHSSRWNRNTAVADIAGLIP